MADTLRERLAAEKLAGVKVEGGYQFRTNENAALAAVDVVVAWLREEADQRRRFAYNNAGADYLLDEAVVVESLADAIAEAAHG